MGFIYKIICVITEQNYIGQTKDNVQARWDAHIVDLMRNKHVNPYLQYAWNKYGSRAFEFSIIEECDNDKLGELETRHIEDMLRVYEPHMLFNISQNTKKITVPDVEIQKDIEPTKIHVITDKERVYISLFDDNKDEILNRIRAKQTKVSIIADVLGATPGTSLRYKIFSKLYNDLASIERIE